MHWSYWSFKMRRFSPPHPDAGAAWSRLNRARVCGVVALLAFGLTGVAGCERGPDEPTATTATDSTGSAAEAKPAPKPQHTSVPFIAKRSELDLRVLNFNIDSGFDRRDGGQRYIEREEFARVVRATAPDIITLQEVNPKYDEAWLANHFAEIVEGDETWYVTRSGSGNGTIRTVIAAQFPLSMTGWQPDPAAFADDPDRDARICYALVDLPDARSLVDLYIATVHFKCCGDTENDPIRQEEADAVVAHLRDAVTPGGNFDIPEGAGILVTGDLNTVGGPQILATIVDGNIHDEETFGPDQPLDRDNSALTDVRPKHNALGKDDYTWRSDGGRFPPGRLDYVIVSDSVLEVTHSYVLNTTEMSDELLAAEGLERYDVLETPPGRFDHLPMVVDFRMPQPNDD